MTQPKATGKTKRLQPHSRELTGELELFLSEKGYTQAAVARGIGFSDSALSQWLSEKYQGDVKTLEHAITGFLQRERERGKAPKVKMPFAMTSAARKVFEVATIAHLDGDIVVAVGDAGTGKTTAVKEYTALNPGVILIEADLGYTARDLFAELHKKCGFDGGGSINRMKDDVIDKLKDSGRLIIIDEAEHLPVRALDLLRRVNDKAGVGILFCGLPRFLENLRIKQADFAYLYTRVAMKTVLNRLHESEIETLAGPVLPNVNDYARELYQASGGNCRTLSKLVALLPRRAEINNRTIDAAFVLDTAKMLTV